MRVIPPITIRAAQVVSSTIPYPDTGETAWATSTAYSLGSTVAYEIDGLIHKFESKQAHTSDSTKVPQAYPDDVTNAYWIDLGAVNRYRMFQLERNTQSEGASPLVVEVSPGARVGEIGFGNMDADYVQVQVYNGADLIFDETQYLVNRVVKSWHDYFYSPFRLIQNTLFSNLPILATAKIRITFTKASGNVKVGFIVMGMPFELGDTEFKAQASSLNFSEIERDTFGEAKLTKRRSIPKTSQAVVIQKENLDQAMVIMNKLNAEVALWSGISNPLDGYFNAMFIIGVYKDTEFTLNNARNVVMNLEIEQI